MVLVNDGVAFKEGLSYFIHYTRENRAAELEEYEIDSGTFRKIYLKFDSILGEFLNNKFGFAIPSGPRQCTAEAVTATGDFFGHNDRLTLNLSFRRIKSAIGDYQLLGQMSTGARGAHGAIINMPYIKDCLAYRDMFNEDNFVDSVCLIAIHETGHIFDIPSDKTNRPSATYIDTSGQYHCKVDNCIMHGDEAVPEDPLQNIEYKSKKLSEDLENLRNPQFNGNIFCEHCQRDFVELYS